MLERITPVIGGYVKFVDNFVLWVENRRTKIEQIITIFEDFPPLTTRLQCQSEFMKKCFLHNDINWYLSNRDNKYDFASRFS
jgi:hypothetical protein